MALLPRLKRLVVISRYQASKKKHQSLHCITLQYKEITNQSIVPLVYLTALPQKERKGTSPVVPRLEQPGNWAAARVPAESNTSYGVLVAVAVADGDVRPCCFDQS